MNQDVNGNRKLFWKELSKVNEGKVENCSRIRMKMGRRLALKDTELRITKYLQGHYNVDTQEQVVVHMCGFDEVQRSNYFKGE